MLNEAFGKTFPAYNCDGRDLLVLVRLLLKKNMTEGVQTQHHISELYLQSSHNYCFSSRGDEDERLKA